MIKVGFIGAGDIAYLHGEGVQQAEGATLVGIWNRTRSKAKEKATLFNCKIFSSPEELIEAVDAVYVLTNMETHHTYAKMAIEAGKHVLVEKPTAVTISEIEDLIAAAEKNSVKVAPVHNYIYEPSVLRAKEMIDSGKIGDLVSLYVLYNIHHPEEVAARYPGVIRQILTHHAYCSLYLVGQPEMISCMKSTINDGSVPQENIAMVTMKMKNQALSHLCASFASDDHAGDPWTFMIKLIGTKGATRYSYRDWVENTPAVVHSQTYSAYPYTIRETGKHFLERVIGHGEEPLSTLDDAITCMKMIEACELSVSEDRHIRIDN
ncbi:MAG: Gfo/Idh/MocA family oxidoreductase [Verrucomicrobiota bacterium]|nr:Gfo/Idh/MocA family oxidoreductase [Verrucomicrobiota bacterium]